MLDLFGQHCYQYISNMFHFRQWSSGSSCVQLRLKLSKSELCVHPCTSQSCAQQRRREVGKQFFSIEVCMHRCAPHMHTRAQEDELTTTTRTAALGRCIEQDKNKKRLLTGIIHT